MRITIPRIMRSKAPMLPPTAPPITFLEFLVVMGVSADEFFV
jgi:hypothetical protein